MNEAEERVVPKLIDFGAFAEYRRMTNVDKIGRRALANNAFDGILTMIGVLMGSYIGGIQEARIVLSTGLATCMAMGISGAWGSWFAESAERKQDMRELGQAMLRDMGQSKHARASRFAVVVVSLIDGLAPLVAGLVAISPFLFASVWPNILYTYVASLIMSFFALFGLGAFLARVARESIIRSGLRMILAGLVCVGLSFLLNTKG